jgi:hypothetical protein
MHGFSRFFKTLLQWDFSSTAKDFIDQMVAAYQLMAAEIYYLNEFNRSWLFDEEQFGKRTGT